MERWWWSLWMCVNQRGGRRRRKRMGKLKRKKRLGVGLGWGSLGAAFLQDPKLIAQLVAPALIMVTLHFSWNNCCSYYVLLGSIFEHILVWLSHSVCLFKTLYENIFQRPCGVGIHTMPLVRILWELWEGNYDSFFCAFPLPEAYHSVGVSSPPWVGGWVHKSDNCIQ